MKHPSIPPDSNIDYSNEAASLFRHLDNPDIKKLINEYNERYLYWDELKYKKIPDDISHEDLWKLVKQSRKLSQFGIKISDVSGFIFTYNITNQITKLLHQFDLNLGGILEGATTIPNDEKDRYLVNSLMEEAIASSQLEGAVTTRKVAKEMLRAERKPRNISEKMILNNYLTIKEVKKYKHEKLSSKLIRKIHSIVTKDTLDNPENEGVFRTTNEVKVVDVTTGDVFYTPPDHKFLEVLMEDFCDFANSKKDIGFIHPIIRAVILHFLIGYIHPFVDGNGRTARAIFYWFLISRGYWLLEYVSISKTIVEAPTQYARAYLYTEYDENDLTYFFNYNLKTIDKSLKKLQKYIERKIKEKRELFDLHQIDNLNERQVEIISKLLKEKHKLFSITEVQNIFGVVYQTARLDLLDLEKREFLVQKKSGKKLMFYRSDKFEEIIRKAIKNKK